MTAMELFFLLGIMVTWTPSLMVFVRFSFTFGQQWKPEEEY